MPRQTTFIPLIASLSAAIWLALPPSVRAEPDAANTRLQQAAQSTARAPAHRARDRYRHPVETLSFFGLKPTMTVVEVAPGQGWYTEILAPMLRNTGKLYAAIPAATNSGSTDYWQRLRLAFVAQMESEPTLYDQVTVTDLLGPMAPDGSADLVLTFRNLHNWLANGSVEPVFSAMFRALKPGGVLGIVEHRAAPGTGFQQMIKTGYVTESYVIAAASWAGFKLVDQSAVNANPLDTKDYPNGVWTLPPNLSLGDEDSAKYLAIGESDRMTLKFIKPGPAESH